MNIQSWKRWHWAIIGALAGAAVGWTLLSQRDGELIGGAAYIPQQVFEQELAMAPTSGYPRLRNFSIQRFGDVDVVDMERASGSASGSPTYTRTKFAAAYPYTPAILRQSANERYTVRQFMLDTAKADPNINLSFAWWREPLGVISISALAGILIVGGIWPFIIRLLIGAGFGKPVKDPNYDLSRFKSEPPPAPAAAPTAEQEAHLRELEEEMLRGIQQKSADMPQSPPGAEPAPAVTTLSAGQLPLIERTPEEQKHYEGQYYPVAHPEPLLKDSKPPQAPAFTLIELMVVIAIIALLIAILLPVLEGAKQRSQQVKCMAQLQQIGRALHIYANDNDGSLPAWSAYHTWPRGQSGDTPGPAWTEEMIKYLGPPDGPIYNCPSWPGPDRNRNYFLEARWTGLSGRQSMKLTDIRMNARFVLSGDKTQRGGYPEPFGIDPHHPIDDSDPDDFGRSGNPQLTWPWQPGGFFMHRGGNNVLFDDGHVGLFSNFDPAAMTFHPTKMQDWREVTPGL